MQSPEYLFMAMRAQLEPTAEKMDVEEWSQRALPLRELILKDLESRLNNEETFSSLRSDRLQAANTGHVLTSIPITCIGFIESAYGSFLKQVALEQLERDPERFIFLHDILRGMQFTLARVSLAEMYLAEGADQPTIETIKRAEENFLEGQTVPLEDTKIFDSASQKTAEELTSSLRRNPTGFSLMDEFVESLKQAQLAGTSSNTFLAHHLKSHIPAFFIIGSELGRDLYKRSYPPLSQALST